MNLRRPVVPVAALAPVLVGVLLGVLAIGVAAPAQATHDFRVTTGDDGGLARLPLVGRLVVIDPGHQLGNHNFLSRIDRFVPAGGFQKACNTTGTATDAGYPEATFTWHVALLLRSRLEGLGARVMLTRHSNREDRWGPCVDVRGRDGNKLRADLKISIHGDGSYAAGARGFHVIAPTDRRPWTHDIFGSSRRLALHTRAALREVGLRVANYIAGGDGLDFRSDLATINLSNMPTVMVELGNMRNATDAHRMTSASGRATFARGLALAVRRYLG
jgi:N-acetylmuramoyl-L-alanine amidase